MADVIKVRPLFRDNDENELAELMSTSGFKDEKVYNGQAGLAGELFAMHHLEERVPALKGNLVSFFWSEKRDPHRRYAKVDVPWLGTGLEVKTSAVIGNPAHEAQSMSIIVSRDQIEDRKGRSDDLRIVQVYVDPRSKTAACAWWTTMGTMRAYGIQMRPADTYRCLPQDLRRPFEELVAIIKHELE